MAEYKKYQANKPNWQPKKNHLHFNEIPQNPWKVISIDLIKPLLESAIYDSILIIVDWFSKMACYMLINMNITIQEIAKVS